MRELVRFLAPALALAAVVVLVSEALRGHEAGVAVVLTWGAVVVVAVVLALVVLARIRWGAA